jgi:hypothetical protein
MRVVSVWRGRLRSAERGFEFQSFNLRRLKLGVRFLALFQVKERLKFADVDISDF